MSSSTRPRECFNVDCWLCQSNSGISPFQAFQMSELFSGSATLASEFAAEGCDSASLDKRYGRGMDVNTSSGFGPRP